MPSKLLFDVAEFLLLATDVAATVQEVATATELSSWPVSSATAMALPQLQPLVRPTTPELSPS